MVTHQAEASETSTSATSEPSQIRSAIRPTRRLPCNELRGPGHEQGHRHQRDGPAEADARGALLRAGTTGCVGGVVRPGEVTGGIEMPSCAGDLTGRISAGAGTAEARRPPVSPVTAVTAGHDAPRDGPAPLGARVTAPWHRGRADRPRARVDLPLAGQPGRAGSRPRGGGVPRPGSPARSGGTSRALAVGVDRDEDEVRRGDVQRVASTGRSRAGSRPGRRSPSRSGRPS